MDAFTILFAIGALLIAPIMIWLIINREVIGSPLVSGILASAFAAFTALTIAREGVLQVVENHTLNLWGAQVWYDLLISVIVALFFIVPRARAVGMQIVPWVMLVAATASIGLLAMIARLFWLERSAANA